MTRQVTSKMSRHVHSIAVALILSAIAAPASAASGPMVQHAGDIAYVSGGIGVGEQQQVLAHEADSNLKLVFTLKEGNYVADVNVVVANAGGKRLLETVAGGPFFLAKLAPGHYKITATYDGRAITRDVSVSDRRLRTEYLRWPVNPETDLAVSRWVER